MDDRTAPRTRQGGITVRVEWNDEWHELHLTPRNWSRVRRGHPLRIRGARYPHEGDWYGTIWTFSGGMTGELRVEYILDGDAGVGWVDPLYRAEIDPDPFTATLP